MHTSRRTNGVFAAAMLATVVTMPASAQSMSEELRESIGRIVILPVDGESSEAVTGTYGRETLGLAGGIAKGADMGTVGIEPGGIPIGLPIPFLREIGAIAGGIFGASDRMRQELRDRMAEDLAQAIDQPLSNNALANDVYWGLRNVAGVDPKLFAPTTPIPADTDAILFVNLDEVVLNVQEDEAIVTTMGTAVLKRFSDGTTLYRREVSYEDRDKLKNWAKNDFVLWGEYREFARYYIGRELAAELYERVQVDHALAPLASDNVKRDREDAWLGKTRALSPTLAWESTLGENRAAADGAQILWDVEIYDARRPVYQAKQVAGTQFKVDVPLEKCTTYRWSVRPTYHRDGKKKNGEWMRRLGATDQNNGNIGRAISAAHAYIQDFATLVVDCKAK
ncbi:MAG: hypothetical protein KJP08_03300 [Gammaproteobacteria bacterium]|nr:hypothetical protein [Gammaproteobacteria bacterium]NNF48826.1 hypothetical protein [Woeseiaceae bacterium]MBT8093812.1 hypothetical protein [Gammaproteobacteria bacterium]MBT8105896.1 hypothetical protein [Gammaproteobacteria bacterium]NNK25910.1 hypothetical protein [Woeseiaceae bacterium]